jgi:hypothetical protein
MLVESALAPTRSAINFPSGSRTVHDFVAPVVEYAGAGARAEFTNVVVPELTRSLFPVPEYVWLVTYPPAGVNEVAWSRSP